MARKQIVQLVDDLDGSEADETVEFALDGSAYEIDLTSGHASQLRDTLADYVAAARRVGGRSSRGRAGGGRARGSGGGGGAAADRQRVGEIRAWARENGLPISERGRIPRQIVEQYEAAHGG